MCLTLFIPFMQCNLLSFLFQLLKIFLWNATDKSHYLSRIGWDNVSEPIHMGGLGFRNIRNWNITFMAKLAWSIIKDENKLWIRIIKSKYLKKVFFINYSHKNGNSPLWSDIRKGRELHVGLIHRIANVNDTSLCFIDGWGRKN